MTERKRMETVAIIINSLINSDMMKEGFVQIHALLLAMDMFEDNTNYLSYHPLDCINEMICGAMCGHLTKNEKEIIEKYDLYDEVTLRFAEMMLVIANTFLDRNRKNFKDVITKAYTYISKYNGSMTEKSLLADYIPKVNIISADKVEDLSKNYKVY